MGKFVAGKLDQRVGLRSDRMSGMGLGRVKPAFQGGLVKVGKNGQAEPVSNLGPVGCYATCQERRSRSSFAGLHIVRAAVERLPVNR